MSEALAELAGEEERLLKLAHGRAAALEAAYARLRGALGGGQTRVAAMPPDLLGVYVLLPGGGT